MSTGIRSICNKNVMLHAVLVVLCIRARKDEGPLGTRIETVESMKNRTCRMAI